MCVCVCVCVCVRAGAHVWVVGEGGGVISGMLACGVTFECVSLT